MEITLIRHTRVDTQPGLCYGQTDVPCSSSFEKEIQVVRKKIELPPRAIVFTSPLQRCKLMASALFASCKEDNRLKELDFGEWENRLWDDIDPSLLNAWMSDYIHTSPPNGETFIELYQRCVSFFNELIIQHEDHSHIFLVTHAGFIRASLCMALTLPLYKAFDFKVDHGSVTRLEKIQASWIINAINV